MQELNLEEKQVKVDREGVEDITSDRSEGFGRWRR